MTTPRTLLVGEHVRLTAIETRDHPAIAAWSNDSEYMRNMRTQAAAPETEAAEDAEPATGEAAQSPAGERADGQTGNEAAVPAQAPEAAPPGQ